MVLWDDIELPGFDRPLVPVEPARRQALEAHLRAALADVSAPDISGAANNTNPTAPDFRDACATCRGHCCRKGGNDAYLDFMSTALAWGRFPHLSKEELIAAYLSAVPDRVFKDSCIYHAEHGCNLPQTMRAPVSAAYLCAPLLKLKALLSEQ